MVNRNYSFWEENELLKHVSLERDGLPHLALTKEACVYKGS